MNEILTSKKAVVAIVIAVLLTVVACISAITCQSYLSAEMYVACLSGISGTYMIGQGIADNGQAKAGVK